MYRKLIAGFCLFMAGEIVFRIVYLSGDGISRSVLAGVAIAETVFLAATAGAFSLGMFLVRKKNEKLLSRLGKLASSSARLLDGIFSYFDGSFIVIHSIFAQKNGTPNSVERAEEYLTTLYKEKSVDKYLETKSEPLAGRLKAGDFSSLASVDEIIGHAENVVSMLASVKDFLPRDAYARLEMYKKNAHYNVLMKRLIVSYDFYSKLIHEFFGDIIVNLAKSSQPLSEEILAIKENANCFVENVMRWEKELTDEGSPRNFNVLINQYNRQNGDFATLSRTIGAGYESLEKKLAAILRVVADMSKQTAQIQDIAEKVKVLSINASIEAARAGEEGKGFKVIANEIKGLSGMTNEIIEGILKSMTLAQDEVMGTVKDFGAESRLLGEKIKVQQNDFSVFYSILSDYTETFKGIFGSVSRLIGDIDVHIKSLNPLFQLHEISVQEMDNLNKIISEFLSSQRGEMDTAIVGVESGEHRDFLLAVIREYERKTISQFEGGVLEKIIRQYGLEKDFHPHEESKEIEIF
jgi:hypothetical protein